jgi:hypothetical protein
VSIGRAGEGLEPHAAPGVAAVLAWVAARDHALRGLVHALSNRAGTVGAVATMLDGASAEGVAAAARIVAGEGERLEALLALFRLATADPFGADAAPEPVHVAELLAEVAALAGHSLPDADVRVEGGAGASAAVAPRAALAHALLQAAVSAGGAGAVALGATADAGRVRLTVRPAAPGAAAAAAWLLGAAGDAAAADGGVTVTVPALGAAPW